MALLVWLTCGLLMVMHLTLLDKWRAGGSPKSSAVFLPQDHTNAQAPNRLLQQTAADKPSRLAAASRLNGDISTSAESDTASSSIPAQAADVAGVRAAQPGAALAGGGITAEPPRLSRWAEQLSDAELHGGWQLTREVYDRATRHPNATVLSASSPRVLMVRDFLSPAEVEHLVGLATGTFARSEVVADAARLQGVRTSHGSWLNGVKRDDKVREVQHRIHDLIGIPEAFGESLYVLQYSHGQKYDVHTDHCSITGGGVPSSQSCSDFLLRAGGPKCGLGGGGVTCGDRLATVILYLRSPTKGGATVFPKAKGTQQEGATGEGGSSSTSATTKAGAAESRRVLRHGDSKLSAGGADPAPAYCQRGAEGLRVAPPPGSAVLFWDYVPGGEGWQPGELAVPDAASLHGGCPVEEGEKYIATKWIRSAEFH